VLTTTTQSAGGYIKLLTDLIELGSADLKAEQFQTACVVYSDRNWNGTSASFDNGTAHPLLFAEFVNNYLSPLYLNDTGSPLDVDVVYRNFRNINIFAHCFGAAFIKQLGTLLHKNMTLAGFSADEIALAARQILVVTAGSSIEYLRDQSGFTYVHVLHRHDKKIARANADLLNRFEQVDSACGRAGKSNSVSMIPDSHTIIIATNSSEIPNPTRPVVSSRHKPPVDKTDESMHTDVYLRLSICQFGLILPILISSALINGLKSSISNAAQHQSLSNPKDLIRLPPGESDLSKIAQVIGYGHRVEAMIAHSS
jgi:hypothetical protein